MKKLNLDILKTELPGITEGQGHFLWEATILCLEEHKHSSGTILIVEGKFKEKFQLYWKGKVDAKMRRSWGDTKEATEYAAMGIAILVLLKLTEFVVSGRSRQGTRVDYFLVSSDSKDDNFPEPEATLEVSGILKVSRGNTINMRVNEKLRQVQDSAFSHLPTFIIVTEFSEPKTKILQK